MDAAPETRYAKSDDGAHIAYQVLEGGVDDGLDFVFLPPAVSNIELLWESPQAARFVRRLVPHGRFVQYDKRGQGMSDRDTLNPNIDQRVDDVVAVMDAARVERAVVVGASEGGTTAAVFAATHPERVSHLVLYGSFASVVRTPQYPIGVDRDVYERFADAWSESWGTPATLTLPMGCPSMIGAGDAFVRWLNRWERQACSPGGHRAALEWVAGLDVTAVLASIRTPTLVVHSSTDAMITVEHGRWLADRIPEAAYVEVAGVDHLPWFGDQDQVLDAVENFVLGRSGAVAVDRQLATVLFTDIVGSTKRAASAGDRAWRALLDDHDHVVRAAVAGHGGRLVKTTGDGVLATFDRPGRAIAAALDVREQVAALGLDIRAGLHTGEVEARGDDIGGMAVHLAARVCSSSGGGEVLVTRTVTDLVVGSGFDFVERGEHDLEGVPGRWQLYAVAA